MGLCIPSAPRTSNYILVTHVNGVAKRWSLVPKDDSCPGGAVHKRYIEDLKFTRFGTHAELLGTCLAGSYACPIPPTQGLWFIGANEYNIPGSVLVILATYDSSEVADEGRETFLGQNVLGSVTFRYRDKGGSLGRSPPQRK